MKYNRIWPGRILLQAGVVLFLSVAASAQSQTAADQRHAELAALSKAKDYTKTFNLGRKILTAEPEDFYVLTKVVEAGFNSAQAGNSILTSDTISFAKRALKLIESGKVKDASPLAGIESAGAFHRIALGVLLIDREPEESAHLFKQVLRVAEYKEEPTIYYYFGRAVLQGEYKKLTAEFKEKYEGGPETAEAKTMLQRINQVVRRVIDAYARAVALSVKLEQQASRAEVLSQLTPIYKALHDNSEKGLNELIADVLARPMPEN
jgi:hypothetical protein